MMGGRVLWCVRAAGGWCGGGVRCLVRAQAGREEGKVVTGVGPVSKVSTEGAEEADLAGHWAC